MSFSKPEFILASETLDLRHRILRPMQDISVCHYEEDNLSSTFHLGIRDVTGKICANGTFIQQSHLLFPKAIRPYRLRGMATDTVAQKQGHGKAILLSALDILRNKKCDLLWFNARTSAEVFYQKLTFEADPTIFDIPTVGPHKVMYKWL